jgi:hypothetical protein
MYLVNKQEKELIHVFNLNINALDTKKIWPNVFLMTQSIGLEKGNKKDEHPFIW